MKTIELKNFLYKYCKNSDYDFAPEKIAVTDTGNAAKVVLPHDVALSVTGYKTADELYFSTNVYKTQDYEDVHSFYYTDFDAEEGVYKLTLNRVDLFSEVFLNGEKVLTTDNAFISFEKEVKLLKKNSLVVHLLPTAVVVKDAPVSPASFALKYNGASLNARRPAYSFGWDIFPRIALGGIFDAVRFSPVKKDEIKESYFYTVSVTGDKAKVAVNCLFKLSGDNPSEYSVEITGKCGDSRFYVKDRLWSNLFRQEFVIESCKLWDVKNFGKPNLYDLEIRLYRNGVLNDEVKQKVGVRKIRLFRTSVCDETSGRFVFEINGRETFITGTNWVPTDALQSKAEERNAAALALLDDVGCNMVRVWGGGIYEPDGFYDFCDGHGILVWQDFMMACGSYPQTDGFAENLKREAEQTVKRLRNHPSLALWSGDNECDYFTAEWSGFQTDPNGNRLTRKILPEVLYANDPCRVYLPSSPYYDEEAYRTRKEISEDHCWGPRDFFKSDYYRNCNAVFISEMGYMGIPKRSSLERFISGGAIDDFKSDDYLAHASSPTAENSCYAFRLGLNLNPIVYTFGKMPDNLDDVITCSQITEAEALKYFIERMRIKKGRKSGIIWWNLIDGWPQLSDSAVDYYYNKKLAYHYVKASQQYVCMMMDEVGDNLLLGAVNDTGAAVTLKYVLTDVSSGKTVAKGSVGLEANGAQEILRLDKQGRRFYSIEWEANGVKGKNHFVSDIQGVSLEEYLQNISKCGYDAVSLINDIKQKGEDYD